MRKDNETFGMIVDCKMAVVAMTSLVLLTGCAGTRDRWSAYVERRKKTAAEWKENQPTPEEKYQIALKKYEQDLAEWERREDLNLQWRAGYGIGNTNAERMRQGGKPEDFVPQTPRPIPPRDPKAAPFSWKEFRENLDDAANQLQGN